MSTRSQYLSSCKLKQYTVSDVYDPYSTQQVRCFLTTFSSVSSSHVDYKYVSKEVQIFFNSTHQYKIGYQY